ncbi:MAG: DUF349 domain-containing protein [Bacteroidota bacterium]
MSEKDNLPKADGETLKNKAVDKSEDLTETADLKKEDSITVEANSDEEQEAEKSAPSETLNPEISDQLIETSQTEDFEIEAAAKDESAAEDLKTSIESSDDSENEITASENDQDESISESTDDATKVELDKVEEKESSENESTVSENTPAVTKPESKKAESHVEEIEASNAEDAEDESNSERHEVETKEYDKMSMEALSDELEHLLANKKIQTIRSQVDDIKSEFNSKFEELLEQKKEDFINDGGNEIDFYYNSPTKKRFNTAYKTYRNNLKAYYKARENDLKANLDKRLAIIEEIKGLINVEENINDTYKIFKDLQEQWRNAGPIPRDVYNNAWNSYHHHVEIFYDFLHLNRDLRDLDFKHNLEKKLKIIERAEELAKDDNINRVFRELQVLHKMWKEELGPVAKEYRDEIWERFSTATKAIHEKRQAYYADVDKAKENNLERKLEIISKIEEVAKDDASSHGAWQKKIKLIEALREDFFNAGRVPKSENQATWDKFKAAVRSFNKKKNSFYKNLKKDQYENLEKKRELIKIAEDNKDSEDFEATTPLMKKIQSDWKKIGHVPRKDSDKIWKQFKAACNHYFDRIHAERNEANKELMAAFEKKQELLEKVKNLELSGERKSDLKTIKDHISEWKAIGHVPSNKRHIDSKFNKVLDGLFGKLDMDKSKVEMIKFENKLESLAKPDDTRLLDNEQNFIKKRIDELKGEINQLENNLQFFSNVDESNPLVKDVLKNIDKQKKDLKIWEDKLRKVKGMY